MKVAQAYAPASSHNDEEIEQFYEDVELAMRKAQTQFSVIMGDFDAKVGKGRLASKQLATTASILATVEERCW